MKPSKFLIYAGLITFFSLLYVWQQTEILRLAYIGQKRITALEDLVDKNSIWRYNIKRRASLVHIAEKISESSDFQIPESYKLVRLTPAQERPAVVARAFNKKSVLSRLFGIKRQAEAKTINP